jgi:TorA maturation chaperone TorD
MTTLVSQKNDKEHVAPPLPELDLYRVFAACFGQPSPERFAWLTGKECRALLNKLARQHLKLQTGGSPGRFPNYLSYESAYIALFEVGMPEPPVPLLESANCNRQVPQEIILECVNFYDVLGLRPSGTVFPTDHLVTQLEFLATARFLREQTKDSTQKTSLSGLERDFIQRHLLNWLPVAERKLKKANPPLFPFLLQSVTAYLKQESALLCTNEPS